MWQKVLLQIGVAAAEALIPGLNQGMKKRELTILASQAVAREYARMGLLPAGLGDDKELGPDVDKIVEEYNRKGWPALDPESTRIVLTPGQLKEIIQAVKGA